MPSSDTHSPDPHHPDRHNLGPYEMADRRAAARAPFTAACVLLLHGRRHPADGLDISEVGLGCVVESQPGLPEICPDLAVTVYLRLGNAVLELGAVIVRAQPSVGGKVVLGMHLRDVSDRDRDQIRDHVFAQLDVLRASGRL
jgi:hypothetical protein